MFCSPCDGIMRVAVNDIQLFFDVEGAKLEPCGQVMREKPTLILLHGGPGFDHSSFKPFFSQFADIAQIVYLDHRGNGRSDYSSPDHWTLHQWADDVAAFCQVLGIEKPVILGHSFGGMVAMSYAIRHSDLPGKLILSSTSARSNLARVLTRFEQVGGPEVKRVAKCFWENPNAATWSEYTEVVLPVYGRKPWSADALARIEMNLEVLFHFAGGEFQDFDLLPKLKQIRCPTLVLGGAMDPICPIEDQEDIVRALPPKGARFIRFESCGHGVFRDAPDEAANAIRDFIQTATPTFTMNQEGHSGSDSDTQIISCGS